MTETASVRPDRPQGRPAALRAAVALVAAVTVIVVGLAGLFASAASARTIVGPRNAVGVFGAAAGQMVGAHEPVLAGQRRARAPNYDRTAVGSCVAAETAGATVGPGTGIGPGTASINDPAFQLTQGGVENLADNISMTTNDALDTAQEFLGPRYSEVDSGVFQSPADENGVFNQVRMTDNDLVEDPRGPHLNFEQWQSGLRGSTRLFNYHVWLPEE